MDPQDRKDRLLTPFWGHNMYWGTLQWLVWWAAFAAAGGLVAWLIERR